MTVLITPLCLGPENLQDIYFSEEISLLKKDSNTWQAINKGEGLKAVWQANELLFIPTHYLVFVIKEDLPHPHFFPLHLTLMALVLSGNIFQFSARPLVKGWDCLGIPLTMSLGGNSKYVCEIWNGMLFQLKQKVVSTQETQKIFKELQPFYMGIQSYDQKGKLIQKIPGNCYTHALNFFWRVMSATNNIDMIMNAFIVMETLLCLEKDKKSESFSKRMHYFMPLLKEEDFKYIYNIRSSLTHGNLFAKEDDPHNALQKSYGISDLYPQQTIWTAVWHELPITNEMNPTFQQFHPGFLCIDLLNKVRENERYMHILKTDYKNESNRRKAARTFFGD